MSEQEIAGRWMAFGAVVVILLSVLAATCQGQTSCARTANFIVCGPAPINQQVADAAEEARKTWALRWFGRTLPDWSAPAKINIRVHPQIPSGGATSFAMHNGEVFDWSGNWQGSQQRLLDTVVPHEITHCLLYSWFRKPIPRWIDEGCAMLAEPSHARAQPRSHDFHWEPLSRFLSRSEYPRDIRALYSQGLLLSEWIVWQHGYRVMPALIESHFETGDWDRTFQQLLNQDSRAVERLALSWAKAGRPHPPPGPLGSHVWTGNGWAPRAGSDVKPISRTLKAPLVPIRPVTQEARGPLTDWFKGGPAPQTVPGVPANQTTAPEWSPQTVPVTSPVATVPVTPQPVQQVIPQPTIPYMAPQPTAVQPRAPPEASPVVETIVKHEEKIRGVADWIPGLLAGLVGSICGLPLVSPILVPVFKRIVNWGIDAWFKKMADPAHRDSDRAMLRQERLRQQAVRRYQTGSATQQAGASP